MVCSQIIARMPRKQWSLKFVWTVKPGTFLEMVLGDEPSDGLDEWYKQMLPKQLKIKLIRRISWSLTGDI